jgi:hypothetical protein
MMVGVEITSCDFKLGRDQDEKPGGDGVLEEFGLRTALSGARVIDNSMKDIEIIPLAKRKMERRRIPEAWVSEALRNPDQVVTGHGGRSVAQQRRRVRRREMLLRVVFEETEDKYVVITAYLTSDIKRYWRDKTP